MGSTSHALTVACVGTLLIAASCGAGPTQTIEAGAPAEAKGALTVRVNSRLESIIDATIYCTDIGIAAIEARQGTAIEPNPDLPGVNDDMWAGPDSPCETEIPPEVADLQLVVFQALSQAVTEIEESPQGKATLKEWQRCMDGVFGFSPDSLNAFYAWVASEEVRLLEEAGAQIEGRAEADSAAFSFEADAYDKASECERKLWPSSRLTYVRADGLLREALGPNPLQTNTILSQVEFESAEWVEHEAELVNGLD